MAGFSFSSSGATPKQGYLGGGTSAPSPFGYGSTPAASALNSAQASNMSTPQGPRYSPPPTIPAASTPVKKTTVNNVDGSSHMTEYHAPEPSSTVSTPTSGLLNTSGKDISQAGGSPVPTGGAQGTPQAPQSQQQPPQTPQTTMSAPSTFSGLLGGLSNFNPFSNSQVTGAYENAQGAQAELQKLKNEEAEKVATAGQQPMPIGEVLGRQGLLHNLYATKESAAAQALQGYSGLYQGGLTGTAQQLSGLNSAAGLAQPTQLPYSAQFVNPQTGQPINGGASGSLQDAVSTITQRVQSGQMSYDQAVSSLSGYGQGGVNALQQALGPNFNVAQSNALAGQQGTIGPAYSFAKSALTNLQSLAQKLGSNGAIPGQGSNIPIINSIANSISSGTGAGGDLTRQYQGALAEARNAYAQLLAASKGGTPTDYGNQATAAIPDNATPNDIQAAINNLESLGGSKVNIYGNPGSSSTNTNSNAQSNTNPPGWF